MLARIRKRLNEGSAVGTGAVIAGLLLAGFISIIAFRNAVGPSAAAKMASEKTYVCAETGKAFKYSPKPNELYPVMSPFSGKKTGYPGEACYWTRDGKIKSEPTWVLRNSFKGIKGPTFCPDCGRYMDPNAGPPAAGAEPPPTREQYLQMRKSHRIPVEDDQ